MTVLLERVDVCRNMEAEMEERLQSMAEMRQFTPVQSSSSGVATTTVGRASSKGNVKVSYAIYSYMLYIATHICVYILLSCQP